MAWKPIGDPPADTKVDAIWPSRTRFLFDENVDDVIIELFRDRGMNVHRAERGISDEKVFQQARLERRMLLTHDEDFWDDRRFPLQQSPGVLILAVPGNSEALGMMLGAVADVFWKNAELWRAQKIRLSTTGDAEELYVQNKLRAHDSGRVEVTRFRLSSRHPPEVWEE